MTVKLLEKLYEKNLNIQAILNGIFYAEWYFWQAVAPPKCFGLGMKLAHDLA